MTGITHQEERVASVSTVSSNSTGIDFHPLMIHPYGWMKDSPESLLGEAIVQESRDAKRAFQNHARRWNTARKGDGSHHGHWC